MGFAESKRAILKSFQPGDLVVFYVSRESLSSNKRVGKFIGLAEVMSQSYHSLAPIWNHGVFPQRIDNPQSPRNLATLKPCSIDYDL